MSTQSCDYKLAADMMANCENPSTKGLRNYGYLINYDDIDFESCVRDESNPNILTTLVLQTGKKAYRMYVPGKTPYTGTNKAIAEGTYRNNFTKGVNLVILDNGPDVVNDIINPLACLSPSWKTSTAAKTARTPSRFTALSRVFRLLHSPMTNTRRIQRVDGPPHWRSRALPLPEYSCSTSQLLLPAQHWHPL